MKRHRLVHFDDRNRKANFSTILTRYGRLLPNGNIQPLGTGTLFDSEECSFCICVVDKGETSYFCTLKYVKVQ